MQTRHRFAAIVARAARRPSEGVPPRTPTSSEGGRSLLTPTRKKRDGSCRQAALEKTLHWTGIIHELQPLEVEDLLGALKLEQVTRRASPSWTTLCSSDKF